LAGGQGKNFEVVDFDKQKRKEELEGNDSKVTELGGACRFPEITATGVMAIIMKSSSNPLYRYLGRIGRVYYIRQRAFTIPRCIGEDIAAALHGRNIDIHRQRCFG
jgi:hypothetical protein